VGHAKLHHSGTVHIQIQTSHFQSLLSLSSILLLSFLAHKMQAQCRTGTTVHMPSIPQALWVHQPGTHGTLLPLSSLQPQDFAKCFFVFISMHSDLGQWWSHQPTLPFHGNTSPSPLCCHMMLPCHLRLSPTATQHQARPPKSSSHTLQAHCPHHGTQVSALPIHHTMPPWDTTPPQCKSCCLYSTPPCHAMPCHTACCPHP
jgi:hypothetical protein